jgi:ribosomal protein S18 acetylase RimI-like enzyme
MKEATVEDAGGVVELIQLGVGEKAFHDRVVNFEGYFDYAFENRPEGFSLYVCKIEDDVVGYIDAQVGKWGVGHILGICVKAEHRKKGIGYLLIEKMMEQFRIGECHKARIEVFADNQGAVKFYSRCDFVKEGHLKKDEAMRDIVIMSRFLDKKEDQ